MVSALLFDLGTSWNDRNISPQLCARDGGLLPLAMLSLQAEDWGEDVWSA